MASDRFVEVKGLPEVLKFIEQLPNKIEANILRSALRAGAVIIAAEAKLNVPVAPPGSNNAKYYGDYAGALRDSIKVTTRSNGGDVVAKVVAGGKAPGGASVYYAHMVEYTGAVPHLIKPVKAGGRLYFGGKFQDVVEHPGFVARPFLRPAADSKLSEAVAAVASKIASRMTPEGLDQPDLEVD